MATAIEEQQARDFLKRAEIRTMKKDLRALRESDAIKEKDKIVKIKTLEEQLQFQQEKLAAQQAREEEVHKMEDVLMQNSKQEKLAEKDLKNYAAEQERQQIFLLESTRFSLEGQIKSIDDEKIPALKLEANKLGIEKNNLDKKLAAITDQEKKLETEQGVIVESEKTSTVPAQKKSLEQRRWDLDKEIQEIEKKRWALEKQIEDINSNLAKTEGQENQFETEKNSLRQKVLGMDKSLRSIYSGIMERVQAEREGKSSEQKQKAETLAKTRAEQKEAVQTEQWRGIAIPKKSEFLRSAPEGFKQKMAETAAKEEEQREKFLQNVEELSEKKIKN